MRLRHRKLAKLIERKMVEEEIELNDLESQHSRAYHTGVIDGLGQALFLIAPERARRNPISIVWFDEDYDVPQHKQRRLEQDREETFDMCYAGLFESEEAI